MEPDPLIRAKTYPYDNPGRSYLLCDDGPRFPEGGFAVSAFDRRQPVLAYGSNQSPEQLRRKFKKINGAPIPVVRSQLADFDVVYSAHLASYGAVPATLHPQPGTRVSLSVLWLNGAQLARMHETEALGFNYDFGRFDGVALSMDGFGRLSRVFAYMSRRGCLMRGGAPIALDAVPARNRTLAALTQMETLALVRDRLAPGEKVDDFIIGTAGDEPLRRARISALESSGQAVPCPGFTPLDPPALPGVRFDNPPGVAYI